MAVKLSDLHSRVVTDEQWPIRWTGGRIQDCTSSPLFPPAGGLYTTANSGSDWTKRLNEQVHEIQQDPVVQDNYWAATSSGVYKSTDNGLTSPLTKCLKTKRRSR